MSAHSRPRPVVLCILDGWGHRESCENNAICQARTPVLDGLIETCPHALIDASAREVGLPAAQMGNSEVGHMNLGAGRIVAQDLPRIDAAVASGEIGRNPALRAFIATLKATGGTAHLMGLLSPGGVHSHQAHMARLAEIIGDAGVPVAVHAFLDGRDTPPKSALGFITDFQAAAPKARIVTVSGRYYAMDRDKRWERTEQAYKTLTTGAGDTAPTPAAAIEAAYAAGSSDEFVLPTAIAGYTGMADGDGLFMANFRADRARQLLHALRDPDFTDFVRNRVITFAAAAGMVTYSEALKPMFSALFEPQDLHDTLGEIVATAGLKQLRIAETEKYAHVTFFFNGGRETEFPGEERVLIPSPKVATYDLKPEMSAPEMTDALVGAIASGRFDLIVVNYANGDMVGHSGKLSAAIAAAEAVDRCLGRVRDAVRAVGGVMLITADHGNAEQMIDPETGAPHTAHTMNKVPAILINAPAGIEALADGRLADIAPTLLDILGQPKPAAMTGKSLLRPPQTHRGAGADQHANAV